MLGIAAFFLFCIGSWCQELNLTPPPAPAMEQPNTKQLEDETATAEVVESISPDAVARANQEAQEAEAVKPNLAQEEAEIIAKVSPDAAARADQEAQDEILAEAQAATKELIVPPAPTMIAPTALANELPSAEVNIGLSSDIRQKVATTLNKLLSDEYLLYTKTLKFHWNVKGIVFHDFHQAFKEQYEKLFDIVDLIAERARALGAPALGSLEEFSTHARLKEITAENLSALDMVKQLLADHEAIIRTIRSAIDETATSGDQGTSNFLQDLIIKHEKIAWMLRATAAQ